MPLAFPPPLLLTHINQLSSFLKDLATLRTPTSPYTFLSYLYEHGRLVSYINRGSFIPSRREYADYLAWASDKIRTEKGVEVFFGEAVERISKNGEDGFVVSSRDVSTEEPGIETHTRSSKHLIIAPGGMARIPPSLKHLVPSPLIVHTSQYALQIPRILSVVASSAVVKPLRIAVVGSGQSAAECMLNLQDRLASFPLPEGAITGHIIELIIRRGSLKPSDDSPFANEIFDPASTDFMYGLPGPEERGEVRREYESTNYGVVNPNTVVKVPTLSFLSSYSMTNRIGRSMKRCTTKKLKMAPSRSVALLPPHSHPVWLFFLTAPSSVLLQPRDLDSHSRCIIS